jgi:leucyl aminopeptidase
MSKTKLNVTSKITAPSKGQVIVIGVSGDSQGIQLLPHRSDSLFLNELDLKALGVSAVPEKVTRIPGPNGSIFALVGVGVEELDEDSLREISAAVVRSLRDAAEIVFDLPTDDDRDAAATIEGALLGLYKYESVFGQSKNKVSSPTSITVLSEYKVSKSQIERANVLASSVKNVRDLVNTPPNFLYPKTFADFVSKSVKNSELKVTVLTEKELSQQGFGGILAVGQGSTRPPRLVKIEYRPAKSKQHLALVGKGITFDTGGISLKPAASMVGMKYDMAGAATVYEAIAAIAELALPVRVTSYLCLAENMPSGSATRPNDVITMLNGKTVEVLNTDAEGRLVLGDGLTAASLEEPDLIIDVATLTGAARVALGDRYSALMGTSEAVSAVEAAAFDSGELVWHMPLPAELRARLDSDVADIANAKIGSTAGGMLLAGVFLKEFVGKANMKSNGDHRKTSSAADGKRETSKLQQWAHLDIAGTANNDGSPYGYVAKGATGVMLRTLVGVAEAMAR